MKASILKKYLKKVKEFSKEDSVYEPAKNLYIKGSESKLFFACTDADCGIEQDIPITGSPIIGECTVNVFNFAKIIDQLKDDDDLSITIKHDKIIIKDQGKVKIPIVNYPATNFFHIPKQENYKDIKTDFLFLLKKIIQTGNDDTYPIMYHNNFLYYANPRALIVTEPQDLFNEPFSVDNLFLRKMLLDNFTHIKITDRQIYLKNDTCSIFMPLFTGNKLDLRAPLKLVKNTYTYTCKLAVEELRYYYKIIKTISDFTQFYKIEFSFDTDRLVMNFLDSEFIIKDFLYDGPKIKYGISVSSFKQIVKDQFIDTLKYINIKIKDNPTMFIVEGDKVIFIGGLFKETSSTS